ncbi:HAD family hydrolase [Deinococcus radiopugnans]|uniref:HAD family hydrolase n=1 Tax=Deinococcus radiopugnans TaxID=57497 RepID=UPI0021A33087|nr:HAD family hydrolase [Deinococcus radiopugnans]
MFDLDGTLHDRNATARRWLEGHVQRFDLPAAYAARFLVLDDFGYRPKAEVMPLLVREFGLAHPAQALLDDFSAHFMAAPVPMPHAHSVLRALRARGVRLGVVTNGWSEVQTACLNGCGLTELVDDVVISQAVGLSKPDPAIYRLALTRLGADASSTWFVGDSPRNDIMGPQAVGLRAAFLPTGHVLAGERPDATLADLREVLALS